MDEDFIPPCKKKRREPRSCVRNLRPLAYHESSQNTKSEHNISLKRKAKSSDDDVFFSEVDDEDEHDSDPHKKVSGYRCSPHLVPQLMQSLIDKQRGWVQKIGFGPLLDMIESCMPKSLTMWLVDRVDTSSGSLNVGVIPVNIRDSVSGIMNLPHGVLKVPPPLNGRSKARHSRIDSSILDQKFSINGRGTAAKDEIKHMLSLQTDEDEDDFCRSFVMVVPCIYAAPTTSLNINRNYLPCLVDVSKICLMDWCGFIAEYLLQGITDYRQSKASHVQVPGCVHILPLIYLDTLIKLKVFNLPEDMKIPGGEPRFHFIGTKHLYMLASKDVKYRRKHHIQYGSLMESCPQNPTNYSMMHRCRLITQVDKNAALSRTFAPCY
uniref:Uncharacterized protein n=1 Tax=Avena sativa TaxID=4498 RepID=A0ACD5W418_AVESA